MNKVLEAWNDSHNGVPGDGSDIAVQIAFRDDADPLGEPFQQLAERVFRPLLAARGGDG